MIVVDTNVVAYLLLPGEHTAKAERLFERDSDWAAPILWRSEFRNVLAGYMRKGSLSFIEAKELQDEAESLLAGHEYELDSAAVLDLVRGSDCSAYDCEFVALALRLGAPLVTLDAQLLKSFPTLTLKLSSAA